MLVNKKKKSSATVIPDHLPIGDDVKLPSGYTIKTFLKVNCPGQAMYRDNSLGGGSVVRLFNCGTEEPEETAPSLMREEANNPKIVIKDPDGKLRFKIEKVRRVVKILPSATKQKAHIILDDGSEGPAITQTISHTGNAFSGPAREVLKMLRGDTKISEEISNDANDSIMAGEEDEE